MYMSGPTLRSLLTKVKDLLPVSKHSYVVYEIPCECGKVYIVKTMWRPGDTHCRELGCMREGTDREIGHYRGEEHRIL